MVDDVVKQCIAVELFKVGALFAKLLEKLVDDNVPSFLV